MKILVTGSNGQLGQEIKYTSQFFTNQEFFFADKLDLDISSKKSLINFFSTNSFNIIINCAAYTDVEGAESNQEEANNINSFGVNNLCKTLESLSPTSQIIHISTDFVYEGDINRPITEDCLTNPKSHYGKSKLLGESFLQASSISSITIRTSWLYSIYGKNFVNTMKKIGKKNKLIKVVDDQIGSPTNARDLANSIMQIIQSKEFLYNTSQKEIFHFSNSGECSWFDFASTIFLQSQIDCQVSQISSKDYGSKVERPKYSVLDCSKINDTFGIKLRNWKDSLKECIDGAK